MLMRLLAYLKIMVTLNDIIEKFQEVYYLPDPTPLRMILGAAISPYMEGSPVWLMLVASSGSGKTELLKILKKVQNCYFISNLTENTLLSGSRSPHKKTGGEKKKEVSLLKRMPKTGGMLVYPEFNTLLDEKKEKKAAILSQLRSVYDGFLGKETGLGDDLKWDGKICMIGACTEKYFSNMKELDAAGPRFISYLFPSMTDEESRARLAKVKKNEHLFEKTQIELQDMVAEFYDRKVSRGVDAYLDVPEEFDRAINEIALMLGVSLTHVELSWDGKIKDVYGKVDGTRFYRSARKLAQAMIFNEEDGVMQQIDMDSIIKMMFDTIPRMRHKVLSIASQYTEVNTKGLAHYLHLPTDTVKDVLQELNAINMVTRRAGGVGIGDVWSVKPAYRDLFVQYEPNVEWRGGTLLHVSDYEDDETESVALPKLSMFTSDDDTYNTELKQNEEERADNLFNGL